MKCILCGAVHLPSERCGRDTEAGLAVSARLERAKAGEARVEAPRDLAGVASAPVTPVSPPAKAGGFDRNAYHKSYMREYMRRRRAAAKIEGEGEQP